MRKDMTGRGMTKIGVMAWMRVLPLLESRIVSHVARKLKMTHAHVFKITKEMEEKGMIQKIRGGREVKIIFTEQGKKMSRLCKPLVKYVDTMSIGGVNRTDVRLKSKLFSRRVKLKHP